MRIEELSIKSFFETIYRLSPFSVDVTALILTAIFMLIICGILTALYSVLGGNIRGLYVHLLWLSSALRKRWRYEKMRLRHNQPRPKVGKYQVPTLPPTLHLPIEDNFPIQMRISDSTDDDM